MPALARHIQEFNLATGRVIGGKYVVQQFLGAGWEGEVYRVTERRTGATRAAKLFFPQRNTNDRAVDFYARKLERLRDCPIVIKYHHTESIQHQRHPITVLISEFVDGRILEDLIEQQRGKRFSEYAALRMFHEIVLGMEQIHARREYHGDLHAGNVLVQRRGVHFDVKIVDLFDQGRYSREHARDDVIDCIRLFYDMLGGPRHYRQVRPEFKYIIAGLRHSLILERFPTARRLREHLDSFAWNLDVV